LLVSSAFYSLAAFAFDFDEAELEELPEERRIRRASFL
jgi:hypothetical protein